jgi:RHS repeat-associated protein
MGWLKRAYTVNSDVQYGYDELGRLKTVTVTKRNGTTLGTPEVTTYAYDAVGNRSSVTLPNGITTTYLYDSLNRMTNLTHVAGAALKASYSYKLDVTGRRTNAVEVLLQEGSSGYQTNTKSWTYDAMYRLTNEVSVTKSAGNPDYAYTNAFVYDLNGNRVKLARTGGSTTTYIYDANDLLTSENNGSSTTYLYDANGSLTNKTDSVGTVSHVYDVANKLRSVSGPNGSASYLYNAQGMRASQTSGGSTTHYLIDANNHTGYAQVLEETNTATGLRSYVIGDDLLAQADAAAEPNYYLYDGHGSTRQLASNVGAVNEHYGYDAYGTLQSSMSTSTQATTMLYCGEQYDSTLQMYNLRARYYNPSNGRFNQRDAYNGNKYDPQSLHRYLYANGDPINGRDPSGNETLISTSISSAISATLNALYNVAVFAARARAIEKLFFPLVPIAAGQVPGFDKEMAHLCADSYPGPQGLGPQGWGSWQAANQHDLDDRGLGNSIWSTTGFFSQLYINGGDYALAYRGTSTDFSTWADKASDWYANFAQGALGPVLHTQYDEAVAIAEQVDAAVGKDNSLTITGHSLGGGLAAAAAYDTDRPCVTFNSAALNEMSWFYWGGLHYKSSMVNYTVKGEVLTTLQRTVSLAPATTFCQQYVLEPGSNFQNCSGIGGMIKLHGMDSVLNALGEPPN